MSPVAHCAYSPHLLIFFLYMDQANFRLKGKLLEIFDTANVNATFRKREFVVEYYESERANRPELLKFQLIQDQCVILDQFEVGDQVVIDFALKGRDWVNPKGEKIYFNSLQANAIQPAAGASPPAFSNQGAPPPPNTLDDDLPF
jgi:hypothetical protein